MITDYGWQVAETIDKYPIERSVYGEDDEGLERYDQAIIDGECCVFHVVNPDLSDDEEVA